MTTKCGSPNIPLLSLWFLPSVARADRRIDDFRFPNNSSTCPGAVAEIEEINQILKNNNNKVQETTFNF